MPPPLPSCILIISSKIQPKEYQKKMKLLSWGNKPFGTLEALMIVQTYMVGVLRREEAYLLSVEILIAAAYSRITDINGIVYLTRSNV